MMLIFSVNRFPKLVNLYYELSQNSQKVGSLASIFVVVGWESYKITKDPKQVIHWLSCIFVFLKPFLFLMLLTNQLTVGIIFKILIKHAHTHTHREQQQWLNWKRKKGLQNSLSFSINALIKTDVPTLFSWLLMYSEWLLLVCNKHIDC